MAATLVALAAAARRRTASSVPTVDAEKLAAAGPGAGTGGGGKEASQVSIKDFRVGQTLEGRIVQIYCPGGVSVDVGCRETLGFLEVEEFRDGFPIQGPFFYKPGDRVTVRVLDINPRAVVNDHGEPDPHGDYGDNGKLHLSMRSGDLARPPRYVADASRPANLKPFLDISPMTWLDGEVVMMSSWAVFVKVESPEGEPFVGILSQADFAGDFAEKVVRGCRVRVRIKEADIKCRRLLLTMVDP